MQAYSNQKRASDPYSLPDIEVFHMTATEAADMEIENGGWFWWSCSPGCLPDSDPIGPFDTADEALADARENVDDDDDDALLQERLEIEADIADKLSR